MSKLSTLALIACLVMSVGSSGADAARFVGGPPPSTGGQGGQPSTCVVDCLQITKNPHADCATQPKVVTLAPAALVLGPVKKNPCASTSSDFEACGAKLGNLRRVTVAQVRRIDDEDTVHLVPLCDIVHRSLTQHETTFLARGNVHGLILPISQNDTLMSALDDGGYHAHDVLGIVRAPNAVILYVSRAPH